MIEKQKRGHENTEDMYVPSKWLLDRIWMICSLPAIVNLLAGGLSNDESLKATHYLMGCLHGLWLWSAFMIGLPTAKRFVVALLAEVIRKMESPV